MDEKNKDQRFLSRGRLNQIAYDLGGKGIDGSVAVSDIMKMLDEIHTARKTARIINERLSSYARPENEPCPT